MTNQELTRLLKGNNYKRIALDNDIHEPKTFYIYRRGLHWGGLPYAQPPF